MRIFAFLKTREIVASQKHRRRMRFRNKIVKTQRDKISVKLDYKKTLNSLWRACHCVSSYSEKSTTVFRHTKILISFCSLDVRGKPLNQASHWAESSALGRRTSFRTQVVPNSLLVEDLTLQVYNNTMYPVTKMLKVS